MADDKWVYDFAEGSKDMRDLLGGKGANVAEMTRVLGADRVPAGFTITTEACVAYMKAGQEEPEGMAEQVAEALERLQEHTGKQLGDDEDPLLVSVRSGARESMPGMLDTVLNLGLNDTSVEGPGQEPPRTSASRGTPTGASCRCSATSAAASTARPSRRRSRASRTTPASRRTPTSTSTRSRSWSSASRRSTRSRRATSSRRTRRSSCGSSIRAVFDSWTGDRAKSYRQINRIPDDWGTAVNVQQMVFGNKGDTSGSGVAFSRDEVTGAPEPSGDFLPNAQGEDVVSGARTPRDIAEMKDWLPDAYEQLMDILRTLEKHYGDMQDTEFTVEEGQLYMLQTRDAKRPAQAAVRFARDAVEEGLLDRDQALMTVDAEMLTALLVKTFDPNADYEVIAKGVPAAPGGAKGEVVFTAQEAVEAAAEEAAAVVLVRPDTNANDVAGFHAAKGILTSLGGKASHAALVARGMGVPCVTAASGLKINLEERVIRVGEHEIEAGDFIAINGTNGEVTLDDVPLVDPTEDPAFDEILKAFETVLGWADDVRRLGRARERRHAGTTPTRRASWARRASGCAAPSTCSWPTTASRRCGGWSWPTTREARKDALAELLPLQQEDFEGLFEAMKGLPVTIRLLDPPLHEFLPDLPDLAAQVERARIECTDDLQELEKLLEIDRADLRGEPDAGHARLPARDPLSRDLRDAGPRDPARGEGDGRAAAPRDHDPARRLRARARDHARAGGPDRRGGGAARGRGLHRRDHDRAASRVFCCRSDRKICGFLLFWHK